MKAFEWKTVGQGAMHEFHVHGKKVATLWRSDRSECWFVTTVDADRQHKVHGHEVLTEAKSLVEKEFARQIAKVATKKATSAQKLEEYVSVSNKSGSEMALHPAARWDEALAGGTVSWVTHDVDERPMHVVRRFKARSWDEAMDLHREFLFG